MLLYVSLAKKGPKNKTNVNKESVSEADYLKKSQFKIAPKKKRSRRKEFELIKKRERQKETKKIFSIFLSLSS